MKHKFFPLDKNYILKEAQAACKMKLLNESIEEVKKAYHLLFNPLGLEDDTTVFIQSAKQYKLKELEELYEALAGIYRYKFGSNQLEFLFDGRTHFEKYCDDWSEIFIHWIREYAQHPQFVRGVLDASIFHQKHQKAQMAGNKLRAFICDQMNFKFRKSGEYIKLKVAF